MLADEVATLCTVFEHVGVLAEPAHLSGKRRGNCVLLASAHPLPEGIDRVLRSDPVSVRLARSAQVTALRRARRVLACLCGWSYRTGADGWGAEALGAATRQTC